MANSKLGRNALQDIRDSIGRCADSTQISAEADRLAKHYGVSKSQIYAVTKDIRRKIVSRKPRADKGKRTADLMTHPGLKFAASLVVAYNADPFESYRQAQQEGFEMPVSVETFRRYMNEHEINKKQSVPGRTAYRSFQASRPGEIFQFDISGAKQRFYDPKTRKIVTVSELEASENHPMDNPRRVKIWRFKMLDDDSRRVFTRYYAVNKPNGSHVVDFLLRAYGEMGVPETLYCDNDAVIKFAKNAAAAKFINKALENCGGYKLQHHTPGNARATGKVERAHQESEKSEKLLGLFLARGRELTMDALENFAVEKDAQYNNTRHRTTGESPFERWESRPHTVRKLDYDVLRAALLADEYDITLKGNLSFDLQGKTYQIPTDQQFQDLYEAQQRTKRKLKVYFSTAADFFTLVDFEGGQFDIPVVHFAPDVAGEFKSTAESKGERNRKELKKFAKEQAKVEKDRAEIGIEQKPILYFDSQTAAEIAEENARKKSESGVLQFPLPTVNVTEQIAGNLPAGRASFVEKNYSGKLVNFWDAVKIFASEFADVAECKQFLDTVFPTREDKLPRAEIETAMRDYHKPQRILRAV